MTISEKIGKWAEIVGQDVLATPPEVLTKGKLSFGVGLIEEEINELTSEVNQAYLDGKLDVNMMKDHIGDSIWVLIRLAQTLGISVDDVMQEVYNSNMSKVCSNEEEATQTADAYAKGVHPDKQGEVIRCYTHRINEDAIIVKRSPDDKVLKNINYKPVNFGESSFIRIESI